jgi:hypothetical protein
MFILKSFHYTIFAVSITLIKTKSVVNQKMNAVVFYSIFICHSLTTMHFLFI